MILVRFKPVFASGAAAAFALAIAVSFAGCGSTAADRPTGESLPVFAGIPPVAYLVEQIGGRHVKVDVLVQPGQDPHTFEPTPQQVLALSRAAAFFEIGMPFERVLLEKVRDGNRRLVVVDTTRGIEKRKMDAPCCESGDDHDHDEEAAGEPDPHVWLSPALLKVQAQDIEAALEQIDAAHAPEYRQNLAALVERLDAVEQYARKMLEPYHGRAFYVYHPGFGYFADAFGLKEKAIEAGGRTPAARQLRLLIEQARSDGVKTVFVQPEFAPQGAQAVTEALGAKVVPLNGLAKDVVGNIEDIAKKIDASLAESPPRT